ncbi:mandelate racemase/muconate lactonizing enzyme family protein [Castellaniella sp.]|uniref:mandelate racemase/muconate lactonizing enzyme family protein n=1 Tax=Castellaniella sp. TaxID=1955812 RepID=UPI003562399F
MVQEHQAPDFRSVDPIVQAEILLVDIPAKFPRQDAIQPFLKQETPMVRLTTRDGVVGVGYTYTLGTGGTGLCRLLADTLAPQLIGADARAAEALWWRLNRSMNSISPGIATSLALAAVDMAVWDIRCQLAGMPLHLMVGGAHQRLPLYDTEGGWLNIDDDALVANAVSARERGFHGFKVKVGRALAEDLRRLRKVRDVLPDTMQMMIDANQIFTQGEAIYRAAAYAAAGAAWFEEPLPASDVHGHALLRASTAMPIAVGETLQNPHVFREYMQQDACSIVQVDAARVGGITPWLKVAHMAEAFNLSVAPHYLMELHVSLACAVPNAGWIEHIPQLDALLSSPLMMSPDGYAVPPAKPGLGIDWCWPTIETLKSAEGVVR